MKGNAHTAVATLQHTYCDTLRHIATQRNILQHTAKATRILLLPHCNIHIATHCDKLQHNATYCNTVQRQCAYCCCHIATYTLQNTSTECNIQHHPAKILHILLLQHGNIHIATKCTTVQDNDKAMHALLLPHGNTRIALHCNTLQHTATHCDTRQHIPTRCNDNAHADIATMQHTHCNTLQLTETLCNILHRQRTYRCCYKGSFYRACARAPALSGSLPSSLCIKMSLSLLCIPLHVYTHLRNQVVRLMIYTPRVFTWLYIWSGIYSCTYSTCQVDDIHNLSIYMGIYMEWYILMYVLNLSSIWYTHLEYAHTHTTPCIHSFVYSTCVYNLHTYIPETFMYTLKLDTFLYIHIYIYAYTYVMYI